MAKGDDKRSRNEIDFQNKQSQNYLNNVRTGIVNPQYTQMRDNYNNAVTQNTQDYGDIKGRYGALSDKYGEVAKTGGFSPMDIANIRSRAIAPTRAVYANANRDIDRQRTLQGGYSPNYMAAKGRIARDLGQSLSDTSTNAEAMIAQMLQQGRLQGLSGQMNATQGMNSLYGTTPGMASTFGNQVLNASGQALQTQNLQQDLGNSRANQQINASQIPGMWENTMGRVNDVINLGGKVATGFMGLPGGVKPYNPSAPGAGLSNIPYWQMGGI